jgi:hypothetical protein
MELTHIKDLEGHRPDQNPALYQYGDRHIVVSTVNLDVVSGNPTMMMAGMLGGYETSGEETMAFYCDADGENWDFAEIAVENGEGSRERLIERLKTDNLNGRQ